jgi:hypothetical protein
VKSNEHGILKSNCPSSPDLCVVQILIEGVLGQGNTASIALFEIKLTTGYCIGKLISFSLQQNANLSLKSSVARRRSN